MPTYSERIVASSVDVAARQWKALGVGLAGKAHGSSAIDPEALIVFTAALGDADARLRDESMDWCVQYGARLISASRLRNIRAVFPADAADPIDAYLATANAHGGTRWPTRKKAVRARTFVPSDKSRLPRLPKSPALLRLQLRALFGVTARAEVILALATGARESFRTSSDLAHTGYGKRNIALVLEDLALCELVSTKRLGNRIGYRIAKGEHLVELAPGLVGASSVRWDLRLSLLTAARTMVSSVESKKPVVRSAEARRFVTECDDELNALEVAAPEVADPERYFETLAAWVLEQLIP